MYVEQFSFKWFYFRWYIQLLGHIIWGALFIVLCLLLITLARDILFLRHKSRRIIFGQWWLGFYNIEKYPWKSVGHKSPLIFTAKWMYIDNNKLLPNVTDTTNMDFIGLKTTLFLSVLWKSRYLCVFSLIFLMKKIVWRTLLLQQHDQFTCSRLSFLGANEMPGSLLPAGGLLMVGFGWAPGGDTSDSMLFRLRSNRVAESADCTLLTIIICLYFVYFPLSRYRCFVQKKVYLIWISG